MASYHKEPFHGGLRSIVKRSLMQDVFETVNAKWNKWAVLIVDEPSLRMVSSVLGMYNLMEIRVTLVESLVKKRAPFPNMAAVYICAPTEDSVDRIVRDWHQARGPDPHHPKPPHSQLYANAVFLYFTSALSDALLAKLRACPPLMVRLRACAELNMDFLVKEERAFMLDMRPSVTLRHLYLQAGVTGIHDIITGKLVTVCATLHEYPYVRYHAGSPLSETLANNFHAKMNAFVSNTPGWWYHGNGTHEEQNRGERSTLLLLDRTLDPLSPLMHEFTYQAMVQDLLKVKDDKISYQVNDTNTAPPTTIIQDNDSSDPPPDNNNNTNNNTTTNNNNTKEVLLNDNDSLWVELRGLHIAEVIENLSGRIKDVVNSNSSAVRFRGKNLTLQQMSQALHELPEYREVMSKLSQHMHLAHESMDIFTRQNLFELSDLEQTLATGQTEDGTRPKLSDLLQRVAERLQEENNTLSKVRLLAILMIAQRKHLNEGDMRTLYEQSKLNQDQIQILQNLEHLEVTLGDTMGGSGGVSRTEKLANMVRGTRLTTNTSNADSGSEYSSSRYVCKLKSILEEMCQNRLSVTTYPSILPLPGRTATAATSVRSKTSSHSRWAAKKKPTTGSFTGGRQMVFMAGGLCYSELRCAHEVMAKGHIDKEIVLGATHFMNPLEYVQAVKNCKV